jgi:hypothetical protein
MLVSTIVGSFGVALVQAGERNHILGMHSPGPFLWRGPRIEPPYGAWRAPAILILKIAVLITGAEIRNLAG